MTTWTQDGDTHTAIINGYIEEDVQSFLVNPAIDAGAKQIFRYMTDSPETVVSQVRLVLDNADNTSDGFVTNV